MPPPPRSSGFPSKLGSHGPRTLGQARASLRKSPTGPSPKTTESCTTAAPQDRPAPRPAGPHRPRPRTAPPRRRRSWGARRAGARGAASGGRGRCHRLCLSGSMSAHVERRRRGRPGLSRGEARRPEPPPPEAARRVLSPTVRGAREPGAQGVQPPATTTG